MGQQQGKVDREVYNVAAAPRPRRVVRSEANASLRRTNPRQTGSAAPRKGSARDALAGRKPATSDRSPVDRSATDAYIERVERAEAPGTDQVAPLEVDLTKQLLACEEAAAELGRVNGGSLPNEATQTINRLMMLTGASNLHSFCLHLLADSVKCPSKREQLVDLLGVPGEVGLACGSPLKAQDELADPAACSRSSAALTTLDPVQATSVAEATLKLVTFLQNEPETLHDLITAINLNLPVFMQTEKCFVYLVQESTLTTYASLPDKEYRITVPRLSGVPGAVVASGSIITINNCQDDPRFDSDADARSGYVTHTMLAAPVWRKGELIGVVQVINKKRGVFSKHDEGLLSAFADYIAPRLSHLLVDDP